MNWEMINFLFRWDSSDFLLTYLSLPVGKARGCRRACHPSQISCLPRALVPARLLVLRVTGPVPPARPWLAVLASLVGCDDLWSFLCLSPRVHLLPPPPFQALLGHSICLSARRIFSDSFLFSVQPSSSRGPLLKHRACPLCLVGGVGEYVWLTRARNGRHGRPALPPHPGGF